MQILHCTSFFFEEMKNIVMLSIFICLLTVTNIVLVKYMGLQAFYKGVSFKIAQAHKRLA